MAHGLILGTLGVHVLRDGWQEGAGDEGGALARALGGRQGGAVRWQKRQATARLAPLTDAGLAAVHAELLPEGSLTLCGGPLLGGLVLCAVTILTEVPRRLSRTRGDVRWWLTLQLDEG